MAAMKLHTLTLVLALVLPACRPQGVQEGLDGINIALGATRIAVDEVAEEHKRLTASAARACAQLLGSDSTEEQRHDCLAKQGFAPEQIEQFEQALEKISEGYDLITEAVELIGRGWADAQEHMSRP